MTLRTQVPSNLHKERVWCQGNQLTPVYQHTHQKENFLALFVIKEPSLNSLKKWSTVFVFVKTPASGCSWLFLSRPMQTGEKVLGDCAKMTGNGRVTSPFSEYLEVVKWTLWSLWQIWDRWGLGTQFPENVSSLGRNNVPFVTVMLTVRTLLGFGPCVVSLFRSWTQSFITFQVIWGGCAVLRELNFWATCTGWPEQITYASAKVVCTRPVI